MEENAEPELKTSYVANMGLHVRLFAPSDIPEMAILWSETIRKTNLGDYTAEQVKVWAEVSARPGWGEHYSHTYTIVAVENNRVIGFGNIEQDGHIDCMYIAKDHTRKGVASAIYQKLEKFARHRELPRVFTEASITARPFFESNGFTVIKENFVGLSGVTFMNYRMEKTL